MTALLAIEAQLGERFGLSLPECRRSLIEAQVSRLAASQNLTVPVAAQRICSQLGLLRELAEQIVVDESFFMRHPKQLEAAAAHVARRLTGRAPPARVWSAGCSRGEEIYSLAILLTQRFGLSDRVELWGTDVSKQAIETARAGYFLPWSLRGLSPQLVEQFFERGQGGGFQLQPSLCARVRFEHAMLRDSLLRTLAGSVDVVLFRNVAIYMTPTVLEQTYAQLARVLRPDGVLVTAPLDPPPPATLFTPTAEATFSHRAFPGRRPAVGTAGRVDDATGPSRAAPQQPPPGRELGAELAMAPLPSARGSETLAQLEDRIRQTPDDPRGYFLCGRLHLSQARPLEAVTCLRRALYLAPGHILARYLYVTALAKLDDGETRWRQMALLRGALQRTGVDTVLEDGVTRATDLIEAIHERDGAP